MLAPLQVIDSFLLSYNVGDALLLGFALGTVAVLPRRSLKLLGMHVLTFGLILLLTPASLMAAKEGSVLASAIQYKFFGIALLVVAPVLYAVGRR